VKMGSFKDNGLDRYLKIATAKLPSWS